MNIIKGMVFHEIDIDRYDKPMVAKWTVTEVMHRELRGYCAMLHGEILKGVEPHECDMDFPLSSIQHWLDTGVFVRMDNNLPEELFEI